MALATQIPRITRDGQSNAMTQDSSPFQRPPRQPPCASLLQLLPKLPPAWWLNNSAHSLSRSSCASGTWARLSWAPCSGSHRDAPKVPARLPSCLERVVFRAHSGAGRLLCSLGLLDPGAALGCCRQPPHHRTACPFQASRTLSCSGRLRKNLA